MIINNLLATLQGHYSVLRLQYFPLGNVLYTLFFSSKNIAMFRKPCFNVRLKNMKDVKEHVVPDVSDLVDHHLYNLQKSRCCDSSIIFLSDG